MEPEEGYNDLQSINLSKHIMSKTITQIIDVMYNIVKSLLKIVFCCWLDVYHPKTRHAQYM